MSPVRLPHHTSPPDFPLTSPLKYISLLFLPSRPSFLKLPHRLPVGVSPKFYLHLDTHGGWDTFWQLYRNNILSHFKTFPITISHSHSPPPSHDNHVSGAIFHIHNTQSLCPTFIHPLYSCGDLKLRSGVSLYTWGDPEKTCDKFPLAVNWNKCL